MAQINFLLGPFPRDQRPPPIYVNDTTVLPLPGAWMCFDGVVYAVVGVSGSLDPDPAQPDAPLCLYVELRGTSPEQPSKPAAPATPDLVARVIETDSNP